MKMRTLQNWEEKLVDEYCRVVRVEGLREDEESSGDSDGDFAGGRNEESRSESVSLDGEERTICKEPFDQRTFDYLIGVLGSCTYTSKGRRER